jgi:chromate transport protein ChrA
MVLLWVESAFLLGLEILAFASETNSNTKEEKIIYGISFTAIALFMSLTALKMKEAKKWSWISCIVITVFFIGGPFFPFAIGALIILFRKRTIAYFTLPHIPPQDSEIKGVNQSQVATP